jgi:hypothetical protein
MSMPRGHFKDLPIALRNTIDKTYLEIALKFSIMNQFLRKEIFDEIDAINAYYSNFSITVMATVPELPENKQHVNMVRCYKQMAKSEIENIKMTWLKNIMRNR